MTKHELILDFCKQYRDLGAEKCFSNGMCYWFTRILTERFPDWGPTTQYDPVENHFVVSFYDTGRTYDVTGDVTDKYNLTDWSLYRMGDAKHTKRIWRDCIWKLPTDCKYCAACDHIYMDDWGTYICDVDNHATEMDIPCTIKEEQDNG